MLELQRLRLLTKISQGYGALMIFLWLSYCISRSFFVFVRHCLDRSWPERLNHPDVLETASSLPGTSVTHLKTDRRSPHPRLGPALRFWALTRCRTCSIMSRLLVSKWPKWSHQFSRNRSFLSQVITFKINLFCRDLYLSSYIRVFSILSFRCDHSWRICCRRRPLGPHLSYLVVVFRRREVH